MTIIYIKNPLTVDLLTSIPKSDWSKIESDGPWCILPRGIIATPFKSRLLACKAKLRRISGPSPYATTPKTHDLTDNHGQRCSRRNQNWAFSRWIRNMGQRFPLCDVAVASRSCLGNFLQPCAAVNLNPLTNPSTFYFTHQPNSEDSIRRSS